MCELVCQIFQKKQDEKRIEEEQAASARYWKIPACCDDDDDYDSAITLVLSTEETDNSLSMGDEHLDTIPATELDKVIKSSVEDLVLILSESEDIPDTMCDVHLVNNPTPLEAKDHFEIVINSNDDNSSSDDDSLYKENIEYVEASPHDSELSSSTSPKSFLEETNTFHNSSPKFENFYFDLGEISSGSTTTHFDISLSNYEAFSFNNDHIKEISSGSTTTHCDISLSEYDSFIFDLSDDQFPPSDRSDFMSSPMNSLTSYLYRSMIVSTFGICPIRTLAKGFYPSSLKFLSFNWESKFVSENSNADIESFFPSHIPVEDSDSLMEEIDLFLTPDDPMPPSIEDDNDDSERDILILEELLDNYSLLLPENESFRFDIPSFSCPHAKPPDGNTGILNIKMMGDNSEQKVPIPRLTITRVSNQEKSPDLLSHRGLKNFQLSAKCPMTICGKNTPILDVPLFHFYPLINLIVQYYRKFEDSYQRILSSKLSFPQLQLGI
nr:hypothetical protein [Tanacetum cinerariifolium]